MKKNYWLLSTFLLLSCNQDNASDEANKQATQQPSVAVETAQTIQTEQEKQQTAEHLLVYPETRKDQVIDNYFEINVADPYRWLEDDMSDETAAWIKAQNQVTFKYLEQIPYRTQLKQRLEELWNYQKVSAPFIRGKYTYFTKNDGLQNQSVVYRKTKKGEEIFLDPNKFSEDGTTSLSDMSFSKDGSKLAYSISEAGSDWRKIIVIDVNTKKQLEPALIDVKFSGISWKGNQGFYYSSYDKPKGSELSAKTDQHKLYYHKLGQAQKDDQLVFGDIEAEKHRYVSGTVTEDDRYLLISAANSTSGNKLFIKDLTKKDNPLITILDHTDSDTYLLDNQDSKLYLVTNLNAPNQKVVTVDAAKPTADNWVDFIAENENVLKPSTGGGYIFANYMVDAISKVIQFDYSGKKIRDIELPDAGTAERINGRKEDQTLYYNFTNYNTPSTIYAFDPQKGESQIYQKSGAQFNSEDYVSQQVFYESKDGTKIPMLITHKKGLERNSKNPTILYGYGGFNVSITPRFRIANALWLEQGGVYAVANIRGGGEYGKKWHQAGTQMQKQNVFDDFIAAAEYLTSKKYTSNQYLAISGSSNGGLLVGAVMTQRPKLFKVALPNVGVLDMLRYHTFTAGAGWAYDYGTAEQSKPMFEYLKNYSPVHNVKRGVKYPATMITTSDHDDRVVPAHSFKFAAELQSKQAGELPVLIRIEVNAGHGAGTPVSKTIQQYADSFAFALFNMGFEKLPVSY